MKLQYLAILVYFLFISCKKEVDQKSNPKADSIHSKTEIAIAEEDFEYLKKEIFDKCVEKTIPLIDSTNFDNHKSSRILNKKEQQFLGLEKIYKDHKESVANVSIDYTLKLSDNFKTVVVTYYVGDSEMFTYLINYDNHFKMVGFAPIAYDEVAESWGRMTSEISKDRIIASDFNYAVQPAEITKFNYEIERSGSIIEIK